MVDKLKQAFEENKGNPTVLAIAAAGAVIALVSLGAAFRGRKTGSPTPEGTAD